MFKPLPFYIGLRYMRSRKKSHFVSFISFTSMLGICLGVMVLVTVLSVMNGFDEEIHKRFFGMAPEITINGPDDKLNNWQSLEDKVLQIPGVRAAAPFVGIQGLVSFEGQNAPLVLTGILPEKEKNITHLQEKLLAGDMADLKDFGMIIGRGLADKLGLMMGDKVSVMVPQATVSIAGVMPRYKLFKIVGVFSAGGGFNFDTSLAFINLEDAQKLLQMGEEVSGLKLKLNEVYSAPLLSEKIRDILGPEYQVGNWTQQFGAFFHAIKMEKTMMFSILLLIIIVAAFNLVSSLVMVVNDKQSEIAILRTIGAKPSTILGIFIVQGMLVGVIGTAIGLIAGIILAYYAPDLVNAIQNLFDTRFLSSNINFVDTLPSKIEINDLWQIAVVALIISFFATIYPAWRASKTVIAEALHYE